VTWGLELTVPFESKLMKFVMKDSFEAIARNLAAVGRDTVTVVREELGQCVVDIITETPVETGMSAASWTTAAKELDVTPPPIIPQVLERKDKGEVRTMSKGPRLGFYTESRGGLFGMEVKNVFNFEAGTQDRVAIANEYGLGGFQARHPVRWAVKRMQKRIGPAFEKACRTRMEHSKYPMVPSKG
jgi:hypothetical protein